MNRTNQKIKENFVFFRELVYNDKCATNSTIILADKKNNPYWMIGRSKVQHNEFDENIELIVEQSKREEKYGVKLRCKDFIQPPFFRFDSDGPAHRNDEEGTRLENQVITTPHFNSYNIEGRPIAYKNETLKDHSKSETICKDINFGLSIFCMETKTSLANDDLPQVKMKSNEFDFGYPKHINYDNIDFD